MISQMREVEELERAKYRRQEEIEREMAKGQMDYSSDKIGAIHPQNSTNAVIGPASNPVQYPTIKSFEEAMGEKADQELGRKFDGDKPRWDLLPWDEVEEVVEILTFGAKKYEDDNWQHVFPRSRYIGAGMRHFVARIKGGRGAKDPESGKSHLAHSVCCLLFLMWGDKNDKE